MITETNTEKAKQLIKKETEKPIIVKAQSDNFNRSLLEYGKFDILLDIHSGKRQNTIKKIDSGLNHVLAKIATKNKVTLGIDLSNIQKQDKREKAEILSRIKENIKVARKAKTSLILLNYKDKKDAFAFFTSLGASTQQAREAF